MGRAEKLGTARRHTQRVMDRVDLIKLIFLGPIEALSNFKSRYQCFIPYISVRDFDVLGRFLSIRKWEM